MRREFFGFARALAAAALIAPALSSCAVNPATGERVFTGGVGTAEEIRVGREQHPQIVREFGGEYGSPDLKAYVTSIGQLLARTTERQDISYTFTLLNSKIVNAFALPGGYIYITRGLLALADSEAQLAAVLAHELGHVTALHHAQHQGQSVLANVLLAGVGVALGGPAADLGQAVAFGVLQGFSREHEYQSDDLGIRYMSRAGYDPHGMAQFLSKLRAHGRLEAQLQGESPDKIDQFSYLATHPAPIERVRRAEANAATVSVPNPMIAQDVYYAKIDGMLYGDDPNGGFIRGRAFAHPALRFRFEVPAGFRMINTPRAVVAVGSNGAQIVFDRAPQAIGGSMRAYLAEVWARDAQLAQLEGVTINGLEAATGATRVTTQAGPRDARLVAIRLDPQTIYRFAFLTPPQNTASLSDGFRRTSASFRRISAEEARALKPLRLKIVTTRAGDTPERLAAAMPIEGLKLEHFELMNGVARSERLQPGRQVKLITD